MIIRHHWKALSDCQGTRSCFIWTIIKASQFSVIYFQQNSCLMGEEALNLGRRYIFIDPLLLPIH